MKLLHTILLLAALAAALPLTAQTRQRYEINVGEFTSLKVVDGLNVDHKVSADSAGKVVFSAPRSMASAIISMVEDHRVDTVLERLRAMDAERPKLGLRAFVWNIESAI